MVSLETSTGLFESEQKEEKTSFPYPVLSYTMHKIHADLSISSFLLSLLVFACHGNR
jgi:hypothetical protein